MQLLLDTHVFLWWLADDPKLGPRSRSEIAKGDNFVFISAVSAWEISVKRAAGRLEAPGDIAEWIRHQEFSALPIEVEHAILAGELPAHHADPFDRILIAQARLEELTLVTHDPQIPQYEVTVLDAAA